MTLKYVIPYGHPQGNHTMLMQIFARDKIHRCLCLLIVTLFCIFIPGCNIAVKTDSIGSEVWKDMPKLTYGVMESEKLAVLPWNSGRCEAVSSDTMAETELGYYLLNGTPSYLYYTDKTSTENCVVVCSQPECNHISCQAIIPFGTFVVRDELIYYADLSSYDPSLQLDGSGPILVSIEKNGVSKKVAFILEEAIRSNATNGMTYLSSLQWLSNVMLLNPDGSSTVYAFRVTNNSTEKIATIENASVEKAFVERASNFLYGDRLIFNGALDSSGNIYYRYYEDRVESVDLTQMPTDYAYLSRNTLRYFQPNDGYYDIDISTGEKVKLSDPQLKNSLAAIVLPNCIVESTLLGAQSCALREDDMIHKMVVFDGEAWREVQLPQELLSAGKRVSVWVKSISSDKIIIYCRNLENYHTVPVTSYYYIDISKEDWSLELFAQITDQRYLIEQEKKSKD